jgi:hypothetical protein
MFFFKCIYCFNMPIHYDKWGRFSFGTPVTNGHIGQVETVLFCPPPAIVLHLFGTFLCLHLFCNCFTNMPTCLVTPRTGPYLPDSSICPHVPSYTLISLSPFSILFKDSIIKFFFFSSVIFSIYCSMVFSPTLLVSSEA